LLRGLDADPPDAPESKLDTGLWSRAVKWNEWFRIVAYRDFHDVPRYILAGNADEDAFWILDAGFDDAEDAYSSIYMLYDAGCALEDAIACFERLAGGAGSPPAFGCIPVAHVLFDESRRRELKLTSAPIT